MAELTEEEKKRKKKEEKKLRRQLRNGSLSKRDREKMRELDRKLQERTKPFEEWDEEELARGRPRNKDGNFGGRPPRWVSRQMHEEAISRFKDLTQGEMRALVPSALKLAQIILNNDERDERGRPIVPYSVKADVMKWTVEHLVGKPTQRTEMDISVKLQGILASVMVDDTGSETINPTYREIMAIGEGDDGDDENGP